MNDAEKSKLEQKLKEAAPVLNRLGDGPSVLPDHIKARLNSALDKKFPLTAQQASEPAAPAPVHRTAVEQEKAEPSWLEVWRWWIGLATATAAVALIVVLNRPGPNLPPVIQVAMLDSVGTVRGTGEKPLDVLQRQWKESKPVEFDEADKLKQWQESWSAGSKQTVVKVIYDRDAGKLRVTARTKSGQRTERLFTVPEEGNLGAVLLQVNEAIQQLLTQPAHR